MTFIFVNDDVFKRRYLC